MVTLPKLKPSTPAIPTRSPKRTKTPTVLQMEAVECGAAALGITLGYFGKTVPLAELRQACGVSRDGVTAANVLKAARNYGLTAKGFKKSIDALKQLPPPFIVFWHFNHFLVVEGFGRDRVYLNDPAVGPRGVTYSEFDEGYTGIVLTLAPGETFTKGGKAPSIVTSLVQRLRGSTGALLFCVLAGFLLVFPNLVLPAFTQIFIDRILLEARLDWLPYVLLGLLVTVILQALLTLLQLRYLRALKIKLAVGMASRFVWHVLRLPVSFYAQRFAGEISSRVGLNDDVASVLSGRLTRTLISAVMVIFYAIAMAQYDWLLTLIVISFAAVNVVTLQWVSRQRVDANLRLAQEYGKVSGVAISGLQSMETLKASGLESDFFGRWAGYYTKAVNAQQSLGLINRMMGVLPSLLTALMSLSLLVIGGWRVIDGSLTIGMLVAFQLLMGSFQGPVNRLVRFGGTLQNLQGNLRRLDDVLENPVDDLGERAAAREGREARDEGQTAQASNSRNGRHRDNNGSSQLPLIEFASPKLTGAIELRHITYGYSPLDAPLIDDFNLSIHPGQRVALVGGSGSGKSTLAKVVAGLYPAWSGGNFI